jgi:hypothetical protein
MGAFVIGGGALTRDQYKISDQDFKRNFAEFYA